MNAFKTAALTLVVVAAAAAGACGPATPADEPSTATAVDTSATTDTGAETGVDTGTGEPTDTGTGMATGPAKHGSTPLRKSELLEELKKAGLDPKKLDKIGKIPASVKKKFMPAMQKALGYEACTGCHVEGDFKKPTRNLKISAAMWDNFVVPLKDEKGEPLFCDSCHAGKPKNLDRKDMEGLKKFMEDEYEHKLTRADGKNNACSTCHGDALEMKIIEKLWKITDK